MEYPRQITVTQTVAILISTIIGVGILSFPLFAVQEANTAAPLVTLLGILLAFFGLWVLTMLGMRFPNQSIIHYSEMIIGKWLSYVGSILIILFFIVLTSLTAREFGEVVVINVLNKTPIEVTVIVMLLLATLSSRNDILTFAYMHYFYMPIVLFPGILIVILSMKNSDLINILPLLGNQPTNMMSGLLIIAALFQGSFVISIIIPSMRTPNKSMLASIWGMGITGLLYLMIVFSVVAVYGTEETKRFLWPTLELVKTTSLPANVLERIDAAFIAIWVTAVFTTLLSSYYFSIHCLSNLFRLKDHRIFSFFILPIVFVIAMLPQNVLQMYAIIKVVGKIGLWITIVYPCVLLIVAWIRKKRGTS